MELRLTEVTVEPELAVAASEMECELMEMELEQSLCAVLTVGACGRSQGSFSVQRIYSGGSFLWARRILGGLSHGNGRG